MSLEIKLNEQQEKIVKKIKRGKNVVVDAGPGVGKTTLILSIAERNPDKNIIQVTYNRQLKNEVTKKAQDKELHNLEVQTYHSLAKKYYDNTVFEDMGLVRIINKKMELKKLREKDDFI